MTLVRPYLQQPPTQPQLFGSAPSRDSYNSLPASPKTAYQEDSSYEDDASSQTPTRAQQYAHPLHRNNSYPLRRDSEGQEQADLASSEHMLRRKTPKGTLAAAYDGTSVEKTDKPHAVKHILLPARHEGHPSNDPSGLNSGLRQELPLRSPSLGQGGNAGMQQHVRHQSGNAWPMGMHHGQDGGSSSWSKPQQFMPQMDSMLTQLPVQNPQFHYQQFGQNFAGAPNLVPQGFLGPTASNQQGPYGPYWPNGEYVPYRPAAMVDPRFIASTASGWPLQPNNPYFAHQHSQSFGQAGFQHVQHQHPSAFDQSNLSLSSFGNSSGPHSQQHRNNYGHPPPIHGFQSRNPFFSASPSSHQIPFSPHDSHNSTPTSDLTPTLTPLSEYGPASDNGQMRERVFGWAHTIYLDLVKYLNQTRNRGNGQNRLPNGQAHPPRPPIYPKPPRQPNVRFPSRSAVQASYASAVAHSRQQLPPTLHRSLSDTHETQNHQDPAYHGNGPWPSLLGDNMQAPDLRRQSLQQQYINGAGNGYGQPLDDSRMPRRVSGPNPFSMPHLPVQPEMSPGNAALSALDALTKLCEDDDYKWTDGVLLGGCLAYALGNYQKALNWYSKITHLDSDNVEAISNIAATLLALNRRQEAEQHWMRAVKLRPSYFEAVEHLVGLLSSSSRQREAIHIIEYVERSLRPPRQSLEVLKNTDHQSEVSSSASRSPRSELSDRPYFDYEGDCEDFKEFQNLPGSEQPGFGSSGYTVPGAENNRILQLIHAKGNMLYQMGDNVGAARAFEGAVMIGAGKKIQGIGGLIKHILYVVSRDTSDLQIGRQPHRQSSEPVLLPPDLALNTAKLCFPHNGELPGLKYVADGMAKKWAISTTSNSLLSLAKIFQDGMASNSPKSVAYQTAYGVREILALYYLSLSLQPSPSTANNVGILLASVQQSTPSKKAITHANQTPLIPGVVPGSGIALALAYYNYGLNLDSRHAHLFTNLGSLLKDIGQLEAAIKMYEQAVNCDPNFDIALANLANAVKDQGRIADAINYYKRAVQASPEFAEAVCGLANALNSVCGWTGRGGIATDLGKRDRWHVDDKGMLLDARIPGASSSGWIKRVVDLVEKQLADGEDWGRNTLDGNLLDFVTRQLSLESAGADDVEVQDANAQVLRSWQGKKWEGARVVRLVERAVRRIQWRWYQDKYVRGREKDISTYARPHLPGNVTVPAAPTVLPFHTFTCPMSAKQIRLISQRNGLRISVSTLRAPWLLPTVYPPPAPPRPYLKIGYVSSDFNNHPLAHLMQSVFGLHNPARVKAFCYATTKSDNSVHRQQIEREAPVFCDASSWSAEKLVNKIQEDGIHILINLNGYTRGARNEVFAARPAPIQMSFMGFAGTLGAEWCDYLLADDTAVPPDTLRPWRRNVDLMDQLKDENSGGEHEDWVYGENVVFCRDTFFCCDHRQSAPDSQGKQLDWEEEQSRRWAMRKEIFPNLPDDAIILGNFNQLYKIEPTTFRTWLRILARLPKAILWLLRFPDLGESNLKQIAHAWAGPEVANRVFFTDVAPKQQHIARARVCDLFLDTPECNAHTTAADILWSGTPLLTLPRYKYKMCSRMAASILKGALPRGPAGDKAARELVVGSEDEYEERAVRLGRGLQYEGHRPRGRLAELRKLLYEARWTSPLFDTRRWVDDLEEAYGIAWERWVRGEGGDIWLDKRKRVDPGGR